jgi:hypothetical protein
VGERENGEGRWGEKKGLAPPPPLAAAEYFLLASLTCSLADGLIKISPSSSLQVFFNSIFMWASTTSDIYAASQPSMLQNKKANEQEKDINNATLLVKNCGKITPVWFARQCYMRPNDFALCASFSAYNIGNRAVCALMQQSKFVLMICLLANIFYASHLGNRAKKWWEIQKLFDKFLIPN